MKTRFENSNSFSFPRVVYSKIENICLPLPSFKEEKKKKIKRKENTEFNNQETPLATLNRDFSVFEEHTFTGSEGPGRGIWACNGKHS